MTETCDFNPRSREGSDFACPPFVSHLLNFNPRSREGSDGILIGLGKSAKNFNPRSREGSDCELCENYITGAISIHAPAKGATTFFPNFCNRRGFQSTLPRRERRTTYA